MKFMACFSRNWDYSAPSNPKICKSLKTFLVISYFIWYQKRPEVSLWGSNHKKRWLWLTLTCGWQAVPFLETSFSFPVSQQTCCRPPPLLSPMAHTPYGQRGADHIDLHASSCRQQPLWMHPKATPMQMQDALPASQQVAYRSLNCLSFSLCCTITQMAVCII